MTTKKRKSVKITVTRAMINRCLKKLKRHLVKVLPQDCYGCWCPVAMAITKQFPDEHVSVMPWYATIGDKHVLFPESVTKKIQWFDSHKMMAPFCFMLKTQ